MWRWGGEVVGGVDRLWACCVDEAAEGGDGGGFCVDALEEGWAEGVLV